MRHADTASGTAENLLGTTHTHIHAQGPDQLPPSLGSAAADLDLQKHPELQLFCNDWTYVRYMRARYGMAAPLAVAGQQYMCVGLTRSSVRHTAVPKPYQIAIRHLSGASLAIQQQLQVVQHAGHGSTAVVGC